MHRMMSWSQGLSDCENPGMKQVCGPRSLLCIAETQDLGIRELPDAQAQLIEMQLHLEEVSYNADTLQEKVRPEPSRTRQYLKLQRHDK